MLNIKGGTLGPFAYVMPALSTTGENAAFYSETFRPEGSAWLKQATMTFGERDGAPAARIGCRWPGTLHAVLPQ